MSGGLEMLQCSRFWVKRRPKEFHEKMFTPAFSHCAYLPRGFTFFVSKFAVQWVARGHRG